MEDDRATLLRRRIELYRETLRTGITGKIAIGYLRQIESDEAELVQIRHAEEEGLHARGLSVDARPPRPLRKFVADLIDQFDALPVTDSRRAAVAARIRRVEVEIARRRHHHHPHPTAPESSKHAEQHRPKASRDGPAGTVGNKKPY
jgi:hypothetical protein